MVFIVVFMFRLSMCMPSPPPPSSLAKEAPPCKLPDCRRTVGITEEAEEEDTDDGPAVRCGPLPSSYASPNSKSRRLAESCGASRVEFEWAALMKGESDMPIEGRPFGFVLVTTRGGEFT